MNIEFIDLTEVQKDVVHCYAHRTGNEKKSMEQRQKETLIEHTELCQQYYEKIVEHKQIQVVFEQFEKLYFSEPINLYCNYSESHHAHLQNRTILVT